MFFFVILGRHVNHCKPYWFGGHSSKVKVTMIIIDKCGVRGDATLCVGIFSSGVFLFSRSYRCPLQGGSSVYALVTAFSITALISFFVSLIILKSCSGLKKNMSVSSDMPKNIRVGRSEIFFFIFYFFFKKWLPNCFSNIFCFFYIQITVITIQIGNRCGLWGILCSMDHKTVSLSNR